MDAEVRVVDPTAVAALEPVPGLGERTALRVGGRRLVLVAVDGETAWYRRDGPTYGWVRSGAGRVAAGDESRSLALRAGDFLRVSGGTVHRFLADRPGLELLAVVDDGDATSADPYVGRGGERDWDGEQEAKGTEDGVTVVRPEALTPAAASPNLVRETPFPDDEDVLLMRVQAAGGAAAGWHHHGGNVYFGYAVDGPSETEYGPDGASVARIDVGECFHVPPRVVHRDTNPTDEAHTGVVWLCGGAPWVVNVDGPDGAGETGETGERPGRGRRGRASRGAPRSVSGGR